MNGTNEELYQHMTYLEQTYYTQRPYTYTSNQLMLQIPFPIPLQQLDSKVQVMYNDIDIQLLNNVLLGPNQCTIPCHLMTHLCNPILLPRRNRLHTDPPPRRQRR